MFRKTIFLVIIGLLFVPTAASASYNFDLDEGWNLVSAPFDGVGKADVKDNCEWAGGPWWWNPEEGDNGDWEFHKEMDAEKGYWIKVDESCSFSVSGEPESSYELQDLRKGWNLVSAVRKDTIGKSSVKKACKWQGGPWWWDPEEGYSGDWAFDKVMEPTKGYWIKVSEPCVIGEKNIDAEAEWSFLVEQQGEEEISGWMEVGNMKLSEVEDVNRLDRYDLDIDIGADGDWDNPSSFGIEPEEHEGSTFEPVFEDMGSTDTSVKDRMIFPIEGWDSVQPWEEPVKIRFTVTESMLIEYPDGSGYRFIESGDSKTMTIGDKNTGCQQDSDRVYTCRDMGTTTDAEFSCNGEDHKLDVAVLPDEDKVSFFYSPTSTREKVAVGDSYPFADSEGHTLFGVEVENIEVERGWDISDFEITCAG